MDGYNEHFSNFESFTEPQNKAVTFINYHIITAMGIYVFDIGEPDDSGHRVDIGFTSGLSGDFLCTSLCPYSLLCSSHSSSSTWISDIVAMSSHLRSQRKSKIRDTNIDVTS